MIYLLIFINSHRHDLKSNTFNRPDKFQRHIKTLLSARKICLMQFYPLYHHGIRAEPSHRTFDFSNHDHHIKAFEDSHSSTQYWVQVIRIPGTGRKAISEYHEQIWH